jgi:adenylate cyclase
MLFLGRIDMERRLTAILFYDVVGYSISMGRDEASTIDALKASRSMIIAPIAKQHCGRTIQVLGDGGFMEFASAVDAVRFAIAMQNAVAKRNSELPKEQCLVYRIGINIGDVIADEDFIYGNGVNIASRLEGLAPPGGVCISRAVYDQVRGKVDAVLTPTGSQQLKNIPEPIEVWQVGLITEPTAGAPTSSDGSIDFASIHEDKPSIVVLPFINASGDPDQTYFADGITEDVTSELCRFSDLIVITANSHLSESQAQLDVRDVAQRYDAKFVLEGSVRRAASRVRVSVSLVDGFTGHRLWSDQHEGNIGGTFELQDEITRQVVGQLEPEITKAETARVRRDGIEFDTAYDLAWRARALYIDALKLGDRERLEKAIETTQQAITRNPDCFTAYVTLCACCSMRHLYVWAADLAHNQAMAEQAAHELMARSSGDYLGFFASGYVHETFGRFDEAIADLERAHKLNSNDAWVLVILARAKVASGDGAGAKIHAKRALRLSPNDVWIGSAHLALAMAAFLEDDNAALRSHAERAVQDNSRAPIRRSLLIVFAARTNDAVLARRHLDILRSSSPGFIESLKRRSNIIFRDRLVMDRFVADFEAGVILASGSEEAG